MMYVYSYKFVRNVQKLNKAMKKILYLLLWVPFASYANDTDGIRFTEGTWAQILSEAKNQQKLIFVDMYTTWCGPCKAMDKHVFTNAGVGDKFNAAFINYKIDAEKGNMRLQGIRLIFL